MKNYFINLYKKFITFIMKHSARHLRENAIQLYGWVFLALWLFSEISVLEFHDFPYNLIYLFLSFSTYLWTSLQITWPVALSLLQNQGLENDVYIDTGLLLRKVHARRNDSIFLENNHCNPSKSLYCSSNTPSTVNSIFYK